MARFEAGAAHVVIRYVNAIPSSRFKKMEIFFPLGLVRTNESMHHGISPRDIDIG